MPDGAEGAAEEAPETQLGERAREACDHHRRDLARVGEDRVGDHARVDQGQSGVDLYVDAFLLAFLDGRGRLWRGLDRPRRRVDPKPDGLERDHPPELHQVVELKQG